MNSSVTLFRMVDVETWALSNSINPVRRNRLLNVPTPTELGQQLRSVAESAAKNNRVKLVCKEAKDARGYFRIEAQIPLTEQIFDQLFNGRSGYRAQYYLSPEEGVLYNHYLLRNLVNALQVSYNHSPLPDATFEQVTASIFAPHAKIWVFDERPAFDEATADMLNPQRWVDGGRARGRKIPLPDHFTIDVKGAFLEPTTNQLFVDDLKLDRACDLYNHGYT